MALRRIRHCLPRLTPKFAGRVQTRSLSLHEHESQKLLSQLGVPVPRGRLARSVVQVRQAVDELGPRCLIKAQVLGHGRGEGEFECGLGRVQAVESASHAEAVAEKMLGRRFRRRQASQDVAVEALYVTEPFKADAEWYMAMAIDRENNGPCVVVSDKGGMPLAAIAHRFPDSISTFNFGLTQGITPGLVSDVSARLGLNGQQATSLAQTLEQMFIIFSQRDATRLEINPLACAADGALTCLGSSFALDPAASTRQPAMVALGGAAHEAASEAEAARHGLVYVRLDGDIGTVVNGAGLAMATNDAIGLHGGASANFLDAGGKATRETMQQAFGIVARDERVRAVLVNIYGGLTRCDMIAEAIVGAAAELGVGVPMVVRLQGTNAAEGLALLEEARLGLHVESDFGRAAQRVVELARSGERACV